MRTIVDLPEQELQAIKALAKHHGISQAEAIRRSVRAYLAARPAPDRHAAAFGLWAGRKDGSRYQNDLRNEWPQ